MTPKRPIELVNASIACAEAWQRRDDMIEAGDTVGVMAMNAACGMLDDRYKTLYQEWQILGGTSDIESIAHPEYFYQTPDTRYDIMPVLDMPDIDFESIDEIPF